MLWQIVTIRKGGDYMKITLGTRPNINGNIYQCIIDTDKKTYEKGYNIGYTQFHATKKEITDFITYTLELDGYKGISR